MEKDFVLLSRSGQWSDKEVKIILPNIQGQRYVFGPSYPGGKEGEEFIFTKNEGGRPDPTHCIIISVDEQGQYWIKNGTRTLERTTTGGSGSVYTTVVNGERLEALEARRLKKGDKVSFGDPNTWTGIGHRGQPTFRVKERVIRRSRQNNDHEDDPSLSFAESPMANNLILSELVKYLPVRDLKRARLVSKKWGEEGTKALEKRGKVTFTFREADYLEAPENSIRVFRYLHEMQDMKIRNLQIVVDRCRGWKIFSRFQKMVNDLRKLLNASHSFSSLLLEATVKDEADFLLFSLIFLMLGGKLVELSLEGRLEFCPEGVPPLPLMTNLRKFAHQAVFAGGDEARVRNGWVSLLAPLFSNNLEAFSCKENMPTSKAYLQAFLKVATPNLREVAIEDGGVSDETLPLLLALKTPLTSLKIICFPESGTEVGRLERLLSKHSKTLQTLVITIAIGHFPLPHSGNPEVRFPPFPKLEVLELEYGRRTRVSWESDLDYKKHFPSLRKLTVRPPEPGSRDDPVFNALFPAEGNLKAETVREVWIPVLPKPKPKRRSVPPRLASFMPRMDQIRTMFPTAWKIDFLQ